jgi:hypothetical protein
VIPLRKKSKEVSLDKERYEQLLNIEADYQILKLTLVNSSYFNQENERISFDENKILKILEAVNEEFYEKIINKFKEEKNNDISK